MGHLDQHRRVGPRALGFHTARHNDSLAKKTVNVNLTDRMSWFMKWLIIFPRGLEMCNNTHFARGAYITRMNVTTHCKADHIWIGISCRKVKPSLLSKIASSFSANYWVIVADFCDNQIKCLYDRHLWKN